MRFYGDLRLEVLYRGNGPKGAGVGCDPMMHLYDGAGMIPQFVIPNLLAARNLRDALDNLIRAEEKAAKKQK